MPFPPPPPPPPRGGSFAPPPPVGPFPPPPHLPPPPREPPYGADYARAVNGLAIASVILGALWMGGMGSLLAVVFGHVALSQIDRNRERGRGLAIAGLVIGYVGLAATVALLTALVIFVNHEIDDATFPFPDEFGVTTTIRPGTPRAAPVWGTTECPATGGDAPLRSSFTAPFRQCIDLTKKYTAVVKTNKGELTIALDPVQAPLTVNNFVSLARFRYYDATECHRIIPEFVVQCGDPTATGTGGPGYKIVDELPRAGQYKIGSIAMANAGADTNGSQFFIVTGTQGVALPPLYTLFGEVVGGATTTLEALDAAGTRSGTTLERITIESVRIVEG